MQFIDLKRQYEEVQASMEAAVLRALRSGQHIMGPDVKRLETRLADYVGTHHTISCSSGTDALIMALMALGIGPGDAVFTVPFTFVASAEAIATVGATPIFVDVDEASFNLDPAALERAIRALEAGDPSVHPLPRMDPVDLAKLKPRAVLAVDLFGAPADYRRINALAGMHSLDVIEDAAQSFGGALDNRRAGGLATIGCTSFFPAKPLGCYGDGGAIFTDDDDLADLLRSIRVHGQGEDKYDNVRLGLTARLDTVQAAVLLVKMEVFDRELEERQRVARTYERAITASGIALRPPATGEGVLSSWAQYTVTAADERSRSEFQARLAAREIPSAVYYSKPLHLQKAFGWLGYARGEFPVSEDLSSRVFSLPMHPYLSDEEIDTIVAVLAAR